MQHYILKPIVVAALALAPFTAFAADTVESSASSRDYTKIARPDAYQGEYLMGELFTLPDGFNTYATDDFGAREFPLTFTYTNSNPELLVVENCGFDATRKYRNNHYRFHLTPMMSGEAEVVITAHYKEQTAEKRIKYTVAEVPANMFTPNPSIQNSLGYQLSGTRAAARKTVQTYSSAWFNAPDGWRDPKNWEAAGITFGADASNTELISNIETKLEGNYASILITVEPITGQSEITAWVERDGVRVESAFTADFYGVKCIDDATAIMRDARPDTINVVGNDKKLDVPYELSVVEQPKYGRLEVVTTHDYRGRDIKALEYTQTDLGVANWATDGFRYRITLDEELPEGQAREFDEADVEILLRDDPTIAKVFEFVPAPGQFINSGGSFNGSGAQNLIGQGTSGGTSSVPATSGLISLGGFGGYVIFGFNQPCLNDPRNPYGVDFTISGNAFKAAEKGYWTEPGAVQVMKDENGNGLPDDTWYELAGSDYWFSTTRRNVTFTYEDPGYTNRRSLIYTTSDGQERGFETNRFHNQAYFPDPYNYPDAKIADGKLSLSGTLIFGTPDMRTPSYIESVRPAPFGYCDNHATNGDLTAARNPYYAENGLEPNDGFDISWAVDKDGNYVELDQIDFVKVYNCVDQRCGWLGEASTEIGACAQTRPDPNQTEPGEYYLNYANIPQVQVIKGESCQFEGFAFCNGRPMFDAKGTWESSDPEIGTIDANGLFTAKSVGFTTIKFQATDKAPADEFEIEVCTLNGIIIANEGIGSNADTNSKMDVYVGEKSYINVESTTGAEGVLNNQKSNRYIYDTYTWTSDDPETVSIKNSGVLTAHKEGTVVLHVASNYNAAFTADFTVNVKAYPEPAQYNNYLVIEDRNLTQEALNAKAFTCADIFTAGGKVVNMTLQSILPAGNEDKFYLENNRLLNRLVKTDYREYMLTFTGELAGRQTTVTVPLLHTSDYNTVLAQPEPEAQPVPLDPVSLTGSLALSKVFPVEGPEGLYNATYRLKTVPQGYTAAIENGVLDVALTEGEFAEGAVITVEGRIARGTQRHVVRAGEREPQSPAWTSVELPVVLAVKATGLSISPAAVSANVGTKTELKAVLTPENATQPTLMWTSSDLDVATVDQNGNVSLVGNGSCIITAATIDGSALSATATVTAFTRATGVAISPAEITETVGSTVQLAAELAPATVSNRTVKWTSTDPAVATVSNDGLVTLTGKGSCKITASTLDGSALTATCAINAVIKADGITLSDTEVTNVEGATVQLTATVSPADVSNATVVWTTSDPAVATVDENGLVTLVAEGTCTITATTADGTDLTATCEITVDKTNSIKTVWADGKRHDIYTTGGILVARDADMAEASRLVPGIYVARNLKFRVK